MILTDASLKRLLALADDILVYPVAVMNGDGYERLERLASLFDRCEVPRPVDLDISLVTFNQSLTL